MASIQTQQEIELEEKLRRSSEELLETRLRYRNEMVMREQTLTSFRWWATVYLCWALKEIAEPARYAAFYPSSWAYKLADMTAHPNLMVFWFSVAFLLVIPLVIMLICQPDGYWFHRTQDWALGGLSMSALGYAYLASAAMRLDIPHVVDSYIFSTLMLTTTALLVACWHNARVVRAALSHSPDELGNKDLTCAVMLP